MQRNHENNHYVSTLPLFRDINVKEFELLFLAMEMKKTFFESGEVIIRQGDRNVNISIILSGSATAVKNDFYGREEVYTKITKGNVFGEVLAVSGGKESPVTITATEKTEVLSFEFDKLINNDLEDQGIKAKLLKNLTSELADKYFDLQKRVDCLVSPTLEKKILTYLKEMQSKNKGRSFNIPLNREKLAVYLNTDRSALSRELSRLKKEGIIDFYKNSFKIL